ncbi:ABC transporter ATP-binding protein [Stackebrandtia endophytica]|uniref:ABC transporter ATP-binding protein n=1 Tax=Stackebrandtia endophytica TaxID=1496996 RepID=UPI00114D872D
MLRPYAARFTTVVILQVIGSVAGLAPLLAVVELGRLLLTPGPLDADRAWTAVIVGAAGLFVRLVFTAAAAGVGHLLDDHVQLAFRRRLAEHLGRVPLGWLHSRRTGELAKIVGEDVGTVHPFIAHTPGELTSAFVVPVVSLIYLIAVDWRLALITLIPVGLAVALVPLMMTPSLTRQEKRLDQAMGQISNTVVEFVRGIAVVKTFGGSQRAHRRFLTAVDEFVDTFNRWVRSVSPIAAGMQLALSPPFVLLTILIGGTWLVTAGGMTAVDVLPFLLLGLGLTAPVAALGHGFDDIQAATRAVGRIRDVLSQPVVDEPVDAIAPHGHRIEFHGVRFSHTSDRDVLHGVDLTLEPGTVTALVGPSGSGKSTLVQLLPRFFDPTDGRITLGGVDLRDLGSHHLYRHVAFVFQDVQLLRASVGDNIALAVPDATPQRIVEAATAAGIHDRIERLPRGYRTILGEEAVLSGGEAQRLALARALLADTPVLVLDEATAFADPATERAIRATLTDRGADRTVLVIAHRWETITEADTVVMLDDGTIVEQGRHEDLLANNGAYARLWRTHRAADIDRQEPR